MIYLFPRQREVFFSMVRAVKCQQLDSRVGCVLVIDRWFCSNVKEGSFSVNYLIETLGLSPLSAQSAAKYANFKTPLKPDAVLSFLKKHGFSLAQISKVVRSCPRLLHCNPEKTLLPKLEFLYSKGASTSDVARICSTEPALLAWSLERKLIPAFDFLNGLFKSEMETLLAVKRKARFLMFSPESNGARNLAILRESGVPNEKTFSLICNYPRVAVMDVGRFSGIVEEVKEMGFNPTTTKFVVAVAMLGRCGKLSWERKLDFYQSWGWSRQDFLSAFRRFPWCMGMSVTKIGAVMDFFEREMKIKSLVIARYPVVLSLSLEKRIAPRASVARVLVSKGLLRREFGMSVLFSISEKSFLERYVHTFEKEVPGLLKLYREKLDFSGCPKKV